MINKIPRFDAFGWVNASSYGTITRVSNSQFSMPDAYFATYFPLNRRLMVFDESDYSEHYGFVGNTQVVANVTYVTIIFNNSADILPTIPFPVMFGIPTSDTTTCLPTMLGVAHQSNTSLTLADVEKVHYVQAGSNINSITLPNIIVTNTPPIGAKITIINTNTARGALNINGFHLGGTASLSLTWGQVAICHYVGGMWFGGLLGGTISGEEEDKFVVIDDNKECPMLRHHRMKWHL